MVEHNVSSWGEHDHDTVRNFDEQDREMGVWSVYLLQRLYNLIWMRVAGKKKTISSIMDKSKISWL